MGEIPRVLHRIWIGPRPMPLEFARWGQEWVRLHPDWKHYLWTDDKLLNFARNPLIDQLDNVGAKSDVLRYELLARIGGVYVDCDFEPFRPIDPLLEGCEAFVAEMEQGVVNNGLLGCVPGHSLPRQLLAGLPARIAGREKDRAFDITGPTYLTEVLESAPDRFGPDLVRRFPPGVFYPYHYSEKWRRGESFPEAYAAHHWAGSWIPTATGWRAVRIKVYAFMQSRPMARRLLATRQVQAVIRLRRQLTS